MLRATVSPFDALNEVLANRFYKIDLQAIRVVLGTVQAHYLNVGDPAWLFVVAPPGSGKTTISIMGACGLDQVIPIGDFTENTFLSGLYRKRAPGLLEKLGNTVRSGNTFTTRGDAIFLVKDFTTVLSMRREKRAIILSQFREMHDGFFKRDFGTGQSKVWQGRLSVIAAVTPILDRHSSIFTVLGERFLQVRWHRPDSEVAGEWAIRQQSQEAQIQEEVREEISRIFNDASKVVPILSSKIEHRIASAAEIIAVARTHIFRAGRSREIEYVPESEANTRVSKGLAAIARGVAALNQRTLVAEADLQDAFRVGLDCLPGNRRGLVLAALHGNDASSVRLPRTVMRREREELEELDILERARDSSCELTERFERLFRQAGIEL